MIVNFPKPKLPKDFLNIYNSLKEQGVLGEVATRFVFPDEPQFYQYMCYRSVCGNTKKGAGFGCSEYESQAFVSAVAEAIEHYCILYEQQDKYIKDSYKNLKKSALDPVRFVPFTETQMKQPEMDKFRVTHETVLNWIEGFSVTRNKRVLVPASLVYAMYDSKSYNEPIIRFNISTGAACGSDKDFALYRGICEIIERDAYMISFINDIPKSKVDIKGNDVLSTFVRRIERYDLEVNILSTQLDSSVFTFACLIFDKTGSGPAVSTGISGRLEPEAAITSAVLEAVRRHNAARDRFFREKPLPVPKKISHDWFLLNKQLWWAAPHMINKAKSFIGNETTAYNKFAHFSFASDKEKVAFLIEELRKQACEVILVDVTIPQVKKLGLCVLKILIPEMVPLWWDERFRYENIKRLYDIPTKLGYSAGLFKNLHEFSIHPF